MNTQDAQAWERELDHVETKQRQREGWDGKQIGTIGVTDAKKVPPKIYCAVAALRWHKTGAEYEK